MTHPENGTGNGCATEGIIHAEGVFVGGAWKQAISSTPQACGLVSIIRAEARGASATGLARSVRACGGDIGSSPG